MSSYSYASSQKKHPIFLARKQVTIATPTKIAEVHSLNSLNTKKVKSRGKLAWLDMMKMSLVAIC